MRRALDSGFIRYLLIGALNTLFGYGCFALLLYIGLHYSLALFFGTILGILFNFKTTGHFVFQSRNNRLIPRFCMVYAIVFSLNLIFLSIFAYAHIDPYYGGAILLLPMAAVAYLLNKFFVFKQS